MIKVPMKKYFHKRKPESMANKRTRTIAKMKKPNLLVPEETPGLI